MAIDTAMSDIVARLRQGKFPNEQSISQGIVLRLLQELGWDTWDTTVVWPEFQTGEGRADFALCSPPRKPLIVIEVKQPGKAEDAVRQALEYSFHSGIPFVVLTDGKTWSFYLPAEQGSYEERRVYKLDLFERSPLEASEILVRYLGHKNVASGNALQAARKEYQSRNRRAQAKSAIREAWRELVENGDESLVELLSAAVESKVGILPDQNDVAEFLVVLAPQLRDRAVPEEKRPQRVEPRPPQSAAEPKEKNERKKGEIVILGKKHPYNNVKEAMFSVLRDLASRDSSFLERCAKHPAIQGRKRSYMGRSPVEIYPDRDDLRDRCELVADGWYITTVLNNLLKMSIIRGAAEVAGLSIGKDIIVDL